MLSYIFLTTGRFPHEVEALAPLEKEFVYQSVLIEQERQRTKQKGKK